MSRPWPDVLSVGVLNKVPALALGFLVLLVIGVYLAPRNGPPTRPPFSAPSAGGSSSAGTSAARNGPGCRQVGTREECQDIVIGGRNWRFSLIREEVPTDATIVVDFGGPGVSLLSGEAGLGRFRTSLPSLKGRFNLLAVEEPWVTADVSVECDAALSAFYTALRVAPTTIQARAESLNAACRLRDDTARWGFTPQTYAALIDGIAAKEKLSLKGFIGFSWGSVRLAYLSSLPLEFTVLSRPFPVGVAAVDLVAARAEAHRTAGRKVGRRMEPTLVAGRALPVTQVDALSAAIALGYVEESDEAATSRRVIADRGAAAIGRLSDGLWGRYGRDSVSPALLAEVQETCRVVGPLPVDVAGNSSVADILAARFAPCRGFRRDVLRPAVTGRGCVVVSDTDTVAPAAVIRRVYGQLPRVGWVTSGDGSHRSLDGVAACLSRVTS